MQLPAYAELHCISNFSFLRGASFPGELIGEALRLGYSGLAITDECSLAGVVQAHVALREAGDAASDFRLIIGSEFVCSDGTHLVLLARNRRGYGQISALISEARREADKGRYHLTAGMLEKAGLDDCLALYIPSSVRWRRQLDSGDSRRTLAWLGGLFPGRLWLAVSLTLQGQDREKCRRLRELAGELELPCCAAGGVVMHRRERRALRDTLTAIRLGRPVHRLGFAAAANAEQVLRPRRTLARLYPAGLLRETGRIAALCDFSLDELRYEYPYELVPDGHTPQSWLRRLAEQGMREHWPLGPSARIRELVDRELALVAELGYEHFFLTVHDLVRFARERGILCQGRGSAANSALCYCLGITAVDPERMQLLFERFLSKERDEPPDIDVDFEHERREEVIQYVYRKYGRGHAALAATVIRYRRRSALRDVGRALDLPSAVVEDLVENLRFDENGEPVCDTRMDPSSRQLRLLVFLVRSLIGFPRHLSQHVGGFVISQGPLSELVPVENAAMAGRSVIQWEKDDLEALGLLKVDVLALGMLTVIRKALDLVNRDTGRSLTLADVPAEDPAVYGMISRGDTVGVFQIESRAQMSMLPRLRPRNYYDLVIQIAIVRPGPIQGDMVHPYLARREGLEPVDYPGDEVRAVLERTLGVPIFQEQVMQIAIVAAGFSGGEADRLRRAMAAWKRKGGLEPFRDKLIRGMRERGYDEEFANRIYNQIKGFGEYGFPESHSASLALLAYVSAWLKHHHPAAFTAALLNSQPMGFYAPAQLVNDLRRHGGEVLPVDVRHSEVDSTLVAVRHGPPALRAGLRRVKGLSAEAMQRIVEARARRPFAGIADLSRRARLDKSDREALAAADALRGLGGDRHRAYWQAAGVEEVPPLFAGDAAHYGREEDGLSLMLPRASEAEDIIADYNHTGLSLRRHPLALLRPRLDRYRMLRAEELRQCPDGTVVRVAGIVTCRQRPQSASGVIFLTIEDESGFSNIVVWSRLQQANRRIINQAGLLAVAGRLQRSEGVIHVVAERLADLGSWLPDMQLPSRDFH